MGFPAFWLAGDSLHSSLGSAVKMIIYDQRSCAGLPLLFQLTGSIYPRVVPHICLASGIVLALKGVDHWTDIDDFNSIFDHPYVYQIYTFVLGFVMVFRSSLAYSRFWEGRTNIESMSSKWGDAALLSVVFDNQSRPDVQPCRAQWRWQILSVTSLLHGMAIATLGGVNRFEVLCGADQSCLNAFKEDLVSDKVNVVFMWVQDTLTKRLKSGGLDIPSPILTRIFQELSTGMLGFNNALKIHNTPFPFPYVQLISVCLLILTISSGFVMHVYVDSPIWAVLFTVIAVGGYHAINEVAVELEDPFGDDANDLPMEEYQQNFNARLLTMSYIDSAYACPDGDNKFEPPVDPTSTTESESDMSTIGFEDGPIPITWVSHQTLPGDYTKQSESMEEARGDPDIQLKKRVATVAPDGD